MALLLGLAARELAIAIVAIRVLPEAVGAQMSCDCLFSRPALMAFS